MQYYLQYAILNITCAHIIIFHFITAAPKNPPKYSFCAPNDGESYAAMFTHQKNLSDFYRIDNRFWPLFRNRSKSHDFFKFDQNKGYHWKEH